MSAKTGVAPTYRTALAVATNVREGTMTSSPGPMSSASSERCKAAVHEETATACLAPVYTSKFGLKTLGFRAHGNPAGFQDTLNSLLFLGPERDV